MVKCAFCGSKTIRDQMHPFKYDKMIEREPHLKHKDLHARSCPKCGHVMYCKG